MTVLRLDCDGCGRNLVDVRTNKAAHISNGLQVLVSARPGVDMEEHLPDEGSFELTFTVRCVCGRQHDRRENVLRDYWRANAPQTTTGTRVVKATLGRDL